MELYELIELRIEAEKELERTKIIYAYVLEAYREDRLKYGL